MDRINEVRAQLMGTGTWLYGHVYEQPAPLVCMGKPKESSWFIIYRDPRYVSDWNMPIQMAQSEVIPESICRKTPWEDIDKKDIYERDICIDNHGRKLKVVFRKGKWQWQALEETNFKYTDMYEWFEEDMGVKVIGDAYEAQATKVQEEKVND